MLLTNSEIPGSAFTLELPWSKKAAAVLIYSEDLLVTTIVDAFVILLFGCCCGGAIRLFLGYSDSVTVILSEDAGATG